jgi:predicted short-subunit dehydrogenase-like oxidoreductase (DUF2520 family)
MKSSSLRIGFIGAGRAATGLAIGLESSGYNVSSISSRNFVSAKTLAQHIQNATPLATAQEVANQCNVIFITTPDDVIQSIAENVRWNENSIVLHCSGAKTLSILDLAKLQGASVGSLHPMQTFSETINKGTNLSGITFAIEGESDVLRTLESIVLGLKGYPIQIDPKYRSLYHLSGFLACGAVVTLLAAAASIWKTIGYSESRGVEVLIPLVKNTLSNIENRGIADSMTGPVTRGDVNTIEDHLKGLQEYMPEIRDIYALISKFSATLSRKNGGINYNIEQDILNALDNSMEVSPK